MSSEPNETQCSLRLKTRSLLLGLLFGLSPSSIAEAHKGGVDRTIMLEPTAEGLEVLVQLQITGKKRVQVLKVFADQDHDGRWSELEHARVKATLVQRALARLVWRLDEQPLLLGEARALLKVDGEQIELLLSWSLPLSQSAHKLSLKREGGDPGHLRRVKGLGRTLTLLGPKVRGPLSPLRATQTVLVSAVVVPGSGG